jgi:RNA polymerase sigma factor (sigma-70 family)
VRIEACMLTMSALLTHPMAEADLPADATLATRAAEGDSAAFESLYRRHVRRIHSVIWRLVGGVEARADELTQEAFLRAWQALPTFRGDSAFGTWLHRLAINVALMNLRSRAGGEGREVDDAVLEHHAGASCSNGLKLDLERAVATLPPRARAVLVLFDIEGLSHEEISAQLGMAVGSSKAQLHRARGLLRERLGGIQ